MTYDSPVAAWPYGPPEVEPQESRPGGRGPVRAPYYRTQPSQSTLNLQERGFAGLPQRPNQLVSSFAYEQAPKPQTVQVPARKYGETLSPQWPLPRNPTNALRPTSDEFPIQQPGSPGYRESFQSDDIFSPGSSRRSGNSETSSSVSIPDFPMPTPPMPSIQNMPRKPLLGPPPSARRGPSSYYTQTSYVSPIAEEAETRSTTIRSHHGSFASSNVMPREDDYYMDDETVLSDDETITGSFGLGSGRGSRASDHDENSGLMTPALVRQASLGRRTKPALMTIRSIDHGNDRRPSPPRATIEQHPMPRAAPPGLGVAVLAAQNGINGPNESFAYGNGHMDSTPPPSDANSSHLSEKAGFRFANLETARFLSPVQSPVHPLQQGTRHNSKQRLRIDVDAVREAEARGSLTSLPELIRRATRLAANLDRGKTASRLGLGFGDVGPLGDIKNGRRGSYNDMLAAFPPPGMATPEGRGTPQIKWPPGVVGSSAAQMQDRKKGRRCCGMPLRTFLILVAVLMFLVAAAVVIPVVLVVLPRMKNNSDAAAQTSSVGAGAADPTPSATATPSSRQTGGCESASSCLNGGFAIFDSDRSCNCLCVDGFVGRTCSTMGDAGCTTTNIKGSANNATVGTGIPRIIKNAWEEFGIPLDAERLLSLFSSLSMSCTTENALITFNGLVSRRTVPVLEDHLFLAPRSLMQLVGPCQHGQPLDVRKRQTADDVSTDTPSSGSSAGAKLVQPFSSNATVVNFARLSVLLVLLETRKLEVAADAQASIQDLMQQNRNGRANTNSVALDPFSVDLSELSLRFKNGTTVRASMPIRTPSS